MNNPCRPSAVVRIAALLMAVPLAATATDPVRSGPERPAGELKSRRILYNLDGDSCMFLKKDRQAARHLWADGADGVYLFNFFTTREWEKVAFEPPFEVLREIGDPKTLRAGAKEGPGPAACGRPRWSPDGKQLAFVSFEGKFPQLFVVPPAGGQPR